jgi:NHS family xanthosine MFS transporter
VGIKLRLTVMNFLQFFLWGAWLITLGNYMFNTLHASGAQIGAVYSTLAIASLFMPGVAGIIADRWMNAERVYGLLHILGGVSLFYAARVTDPNTLYWILLLDSICYMPTIAMANTVSYVILEKNEMNVVKDFPPIRVWGTVGFIVAMWVVSLCDLENSAVQLIIGSVSAIVLGLYAFTLPACPPSGATAGSSVWSAMGFDALVLFKQTKMAIFFVFSTLLGVCLQITNMFADTYIHSFDKNPLYANSLAVKVPAVIISISQMSETLFILTIPFFLQRLGIKKVMIMSMVAWCLRFGLLGLGNPGSGFPLLILSMIVYGCAFDFFNISGSLFVELEADKSVRASAQGLFMMMTNGIGGFFGAKGAGWVLDRFTHPETGPDWQTCWFIFAGYALVLAMVFIPLFQYKHDPEAMKGAGHHVPSPDPGGEIVSDPEEILEAELRD